MKNLGLSDSHKAKVNTAAKLLGEVIAEIQGNKYTGPAKEQFEVLLEADTRVQLIQLGNCITRTNKKEGK